MKKYVFTEHRDSKGVGSERIFDDSRQATNAATYEWGRLVRSDRDSYASDAAGRFEVYEVELTPEELQAYQDGEADFTLDEKWTGTVLDILEGVRI